MAHAFRPLRRRLSWERCFFLSLVRPRRPPARAHPERLLWVLKLQNTVAVNYAGNPALAVPIPVRGAGVPVTSLQLIGPPNSEAQLLTAGRFVEERR